MCPVRYTCCQGFLLLECYAFILSTVCLLSLGQQAATTYLPGTGRLCQRQQQVVLGRGEYMACIAAPHIGIVTSPVMTKLMWVRMLMVSCHHLKMQRGHWMLHCYVALTYMVAFLAQMATL